MEKCRGRKMERKKEKYKDIYANPVNFVSFNTW